MSDGADSSDSMQRQRCYVCYRPLASCFCDAIPRIDNRTDVLVLQHRRERFHAFNTARIVQHALQRSRVVVGYPNDFRQLAFDSNSGLLFPSDDAVCLDDLSIDERPRQLVIIDGTWHHAKTMVRDLPELRSLRRYSLRPDMPGRYRIRREPTEHSLSTLEATVAALRLLEPTTVGWDQLLEAFDRMVERQLAHPKVRHDRKKRPRGTLAERIPAALADLSRVVVAYGEAEEGEVGAGKRAAAPVYWLARRLTDPAQDFGATLHTRQPLSDKFLKHVDLTRSHFEQAMSHDQFRSAWSAFLKPDDCVVVFNRGTARSLAQIDKAFRPRVLLKSVRFADGVRGLLLDELVKQVGVVPHKAIWAGRAGRRLENAVAFTCFLSSLVRAPRDRNGWPRQNAFKDR